MKLKKIRKLLMLYFVITLVSGCSSNISQSSINDGKIKVVATLFPQYDFVREIGKEKVDVSLLLPPGIEAHSYEPTPQDIIKIKKSNLFIYTNEYMEPWALKMADTIKSGDLIIVDASKDITLYEDHGDHEEDEGHEDHAHGGKDPHIWLDPVYAQKMVDNILDGLIKVDKDNEDYYRENAEEYKKQLQLLDENFTDTFNKTKSNKIIYGGHFAFGYFAKRYNLEYISPYKGFSPDAEPTPKMIMELIRNIEDAGVKAVYHEELIDPKVARILSNATGAKMLLLHGAHNLSKEEIESNITYIDIMKGNMERLKEGLGYEE